MNEIAPWMCYVLGEEILRLQLSVTLSAADPTVEGSGGGYERYIRYHSSEGKRAGWERSLISRDMGPADALKELRTKVHSVPLITEPVAPYTALFFSRASVPPNFCFFRDRLSQCCPKVARRARCCLPSTPRRCSGRFVALDRSPELYSIN